MFTLKDNQCYDVELIEVIGPKRNRLIPYGSNSINCIDYQTIQGSLRIFFLDVNYTGYESVFSNNLKNFWFEMSK